MQEYNKFAPNSIFANTTANAYVDEVFATIMRYMPSTTLDENLIVGGSVAKNMLAMIDTEVKDLDLICDDQLIFDWIKANLNKYLSKYDITYNEAINRVFVWNGFLQIEIHFDLTEVYQTRINDINVKNYAAS